MPACTSESLTKLWNGSSDSANSTSPSSPVSTSPPVKSPVNTLRRPNKVLRRTQSTSSTNSFVTEPFIIQSDRRQILAASSQTSITLNNEVEEEKNSLLVKIIGWYPLLLLRILRVLLVTISDITIAKILFTLPTLWITAWIWIIWKIIQFPLLIFKWILTIFHTPLSEQFRKKRTVLISGGSTIQALHLARNFYSAGVRVIVVEVDGVFSFTKFSTAVNRFYTIPRPTADNPHSYIKALCEIVEAENIAFYVPVCSTTPAYYDALAKPHLELLGCTCFGPGLKEVYMLDDTLEVMRRCNNNSIPTPSYYQVSSKEEVFRLYDSGTFRTGHFIMYTAGPNAVRERAKYVLPISKNDFKLPYEISESKPWIIIHNVPGEYFITCTTIKESQVIANVTCRVDKHNNGLVPTENQEITKWLVNYFKNLRMLRPISGHISFRFVVTEITNQILPLGCRIGVSLPYICHTSVHPRVLWKPCKHFSRQSSGPLVVKSGRYWMPETILNTLRHPSVETVGRLINTVLDKREALFVFWDPLPYCAYYHIQLPFKNILGFVQRRRAGGNHLFSRTIAAPVH
ncbi:uncharacterized protein LOC123303223 [Chrysoperla carnea]|uniref:uncharacterized protein LOC123303223 n=1 Tax=Chrysoperla carnea TaxID=189513 RepID=UPI001D08B91F|nr:uncharacterized protein LOC123303223 [Chrysoperla carnea]